MIDRALHNSSLLQKASIFSMIHNLQEPKYAAVGLQLLSQRFSKHYAAAHEQRTHQASASTCSSKPDGHFTEKFRSHRRHGLEQTTQKTAKSGDTPRSTNGLRTSTTSAIDSHCTLLPTHAKHSGTAAVNLAQLYRNKLLLLQPNTLQQTRYSH